MLALPRRRPRAIVAVAALVSLGALAAARSQPASTQPTASQPPATTFPASLTDAEWWKLSTDFSEPGGYFQSDNFTSNEMGFPQIVVGLQAGGRAGGAYIGVGPEQNFNYITAIRPQMAFIVDIRRQAIIQHLMYKAIFDLSADRADFVSRLFCKPRPPGLDTNSTIQQIWDAYFPVKTDTTRFTANLAAIKDQLTRIHGFPLSTEDLQSLDYVYGAFYWLGPTITYGGYTPSGGGGANFSTLTLATDDRGAARSFLGSEENYRFIKGMHAKNLIVLATGDFAGPKALRAVGQYIRDHNSTVTAFYVSNVEQYLFQNGVWRQFYQNVSTFPMDQGTVFIRPGNNGRNTAAPLCPMSAYIDAFRAGRISVYSDAQGCVR